MVAILILQVVSFHLVVTPKIYFLIQALLIFILIFFYVDKVLNVVMVTLVLEVVVLVVRALVVPNIDLFVMLKP